MSEYGEPWELHTSNSWRRVVDRAGGAALMPTKSRHDGHPDMYPELRVERAVACVNALAGIDDPEAAIREARALLALTRDMYSTYKLAAQSAECGAWINRIDAALAKLGGPL